MAKSMPRSQLQGLLQVDAATGVITWRAGQRAGRIAGGKNTQGYWVVNISNVHHRAHHIVWCVAHGYWPEEIDHIDGNRLNNRLDNLREVSRSENQKNRGISPNHRTGALGVSFMQRTQTWRAQININKRPKNLGHFKTFDEAAEARRSAEVRHGYHPNHGRREATCGL